MFHVEQHGAKSCEAKLPYPVLPSLAWTETGNPDGSNETRDGHVFHVEHSAAGAAAGSKERVLTPVLRVRDVTSDVNSKRGLYSGGSQINVQQTVECQLRADYDLSASRKRPRCTVDVTK